nr:protein BIC1-like [Ipomoea batatas]
MMECDSPVAPEKEHSGREKLKRHWTEVAGRVLVPEKWGQEGLLREWMDYSSFDALMAPKGLLSARQDLISQAKRTYEQLNSFCWSLSQNRNIFIPLLHLIGTDPFAEESAGDDEGDIDGVAAHNDSVEAFEKAAAASPSRCGGFHRNLCFALLFLRLSAPWKSLNLKRNGEIATASGCGLRFKERRIIDL